MYHLFQEKNSDQPIYDTYFSFRKVVTHRIASHGFFFRGGEKYTLPQILIPSLTNVIKKPATVEHRTGMWLSGLNMVSLDFLCGP